MIEDDCQRKPYNITGVDQHQAYWTSQQQYLFSSCLGCSAKNRNLTHCICTCITNWYERKPLRWYLVRRPTSVNIWLRVRGCQKCSQVSLTSVVPKNSAPHLVLLDCLSKINKTNTFAGMCTTNQPWSIFANSPKSVGWVINE